MEEAKQDPEVFAHKRVKQVTDYYLEAINRLKIKPVVIGHSFGGLIAQRIAGAELKVFDDASHLSVAEQPALFASTLDAFLARVG